MLKLHPDSRSAAVTQIEVQAARPRPAELLLHYVVTGRIGNLYLPPLAAPTRANELWRHSCFEAFLRAAPGAGYHEFNFAPSTQWAAYRFSGYRSGMSPADETGAPDIDVRASDETFCLRAALSLDHVPGLPVDTAWQLGLSAVIEEAGGRKSYWALAHPPGRADFHHSDCFALELPAA